jgi:hypothetical protein
MKTVLEFRTEDLPVRIRLKCSEGTKEYVIIKTKQDRLMLQKPQAVTS